MLTFAPLTLVGNRVLRFFFQVDGVVSLFYRQRHFYLPSPRESTTLTWWGADISPVKVLVVGLLVLCLFLPVRDDLQGYCCQVSGGLPGWRRVTAVRC